MAIQFADIDAPSAAVPMSTSSGRTMRQSGPKVGQFGQSHAQDVSDRINNFLRGKHPHRTAMHVAGRAGISAATVSKWLARSSLPNGAHIGLLAFAYGFDFLAAAYPAVAGMETLAKVSKREALAEQLEAADRELAETYQMLRGRL